MQKSIAKSLVVGALALAVGLSSFAAVASAKSDKVSKKTKVTQHTKVPKGHKRTLPGKVTAISGSSITMQKGNKTYIINATGITPVDRKGKAITLADIKVGHKISVRGTVTGLNVTNIMKLRDITLPISIETDND